MVFWLRDPSERSEPPAFWRRRATRERVVLVAPWRWYALQALVLALLQERAQAALGSPSLRDGLARAGTTLVPSVDAVAVWPAILLVAAGFATVGLIEDAPRRTAADRVTRHLVAIGALTCVQLVALSLGSPVLLVLAAAANAVVSGDAYVAIREEIAGGHARAVWPSAPFAVLFAWNGVVAIGALDAVAHWCGAGATTSIAIVLAGSGFAIHRAFANRDGLLAAMTGCLLMSICAANDAATPEVSAALVAGAACATSCIVIVAASLERAASGRMPIARPTSRARRPGNGAGTSGRAPTAATAAAVRSVRSRVGR